MTLVCYHRQPRRIDGEPVWSSLRVKEGASTRKEADGANRRRARRLRELELQRSGSQEGSHHVGCCTSEDRRCTTSKVGESEGEEEI